MATRYSQTIKTNIQSLDYNAVRIIYEWICNSIKKTKKQKNITFEISYKLGDIRCITDDYNEFIEVAYGQNPDISSVRIYGTAFFYVDEYSEINSITNQYDTFVNIKVHCNNRIILSKAVEELKKQIEMPKKAPDTIIQQPTIEVKVGGDLHMNGSAIGASNNITSTNQKIKQKTDFWKGVWQNIASNFIWWLLGLISLVALIYFEL